MRLLIIDESARAALNMLIENATSNPFTNKELQRIAAGEMCAIGEMSDFTVKIPHGYTVVFSIEELPLSNFCRHLSISVDTPKVYPNYESVKMIMELLGFKRKLEECFCFLDTESESVNVVEEIY